MDVEIWARGRLVSGPFDIAIGCCNKLLYLGNRQISLV